MEKNTAHTRLHVVKRLVEEGKIKTTYTASQNAYELGLTPDDIKTVVLSLTTKDFYKSMTTYNDTKIWQDVYRPELDDIGPVYLKITVSDDVLVVSFKEK